MLRRGHVRYFLAFSYNAHDSSLSIADEKRVLLVLEAERFFGHDLSQAAMLQAFPGDTDVVIDARDPISINASLNSRGAPILSKLDATRAFAQSMSGLSVRVCHDGALLS